jgi:hemerythrin-like domain-containing protein
MAMKITDALLAEHMVFHQLFDHLERTLPRVRTLAEVHALADLLEAMLDSHSKVEDELIIEPLEHCFEQIGQQETFHQEHQEIDASLKRARQCRTLRESRRLLLTAVIESRKHFDKEERIIFPMAERVLKSRTLSALGESWKQRRRAIGH